MLLHRATSASIYLLMSLDLPPRLTPVSRCVRGHRRVSPSPVARQTHATHTTRLCHEVAHRTLD